MMPAATGAGAGTAGFAARYSLETTKPSDSRDSGDCRARAGRYRGLHHGRADAGGRRAGRCRDGLRRAGLEPVVHIAARRLSDAESLDDLLKRLNGEAGVRRLLVIGGDVDKAGPFADALAVIQKGRLAERGMTEIGIGAYPEGHPHIPPGRLEASLDEKIAAAAAQGLAVHIVSQFSFSPERIVAWLRQLRACGIGRPVKIGMAGPTSVTALVRFARRCGVVGVAPRPDVGRGGRADRPCRPRPHSRRDRVRRRPRRYRGALFFVRRGR